MIWIKVTQVRSEERGEKKTTLYKATEKNVLAEKGWNLRFVRSRMFLSSRRNLAILWSLSAPLFHSPRCSYAHIHKMLGWVWFYSLQKRYQLNRLQSKKTFKKNSQYFVPGPRSAFASMLLDHPSISTSYSLRMQGTAYTNSTNAKIFKQSTILNRCVQRMKPERRKWKRVVPFFTSQNRS